jgi:hypothetical protein
MFAKGEKRIRVFCLYEKIIIIVLPGQGLAARVKKLSLLSWRILI